MASPSPTFFQLRKARHPAWAKEYYMKIYKSEELIEQGKHVHIFQSKNRTRPEPPHTHDFIEIVYILSGSLIQNVDGTSYAMKHGDMLFLNYGCNHSFYSEQDFSYINICFSPETIERAIVTPQNAFSLLSLTAFHEIRSSADSGTISFWGQERQEIEDILLSMLREYKAKETSWDSVMEHYLGILLAKMLRKTETSLLDSEKEQLWQDLSEYIETNLCTQLSLSALAAKCFYNPSYFSRIFKERFGMTLMEYIHRKRLELAMQLLTESDLSIDEISLQVGYSDRRSLSHSFSKYMNTTPSEYRRQYRKK